MTPFFIVLFFLISLFISFFAGKKFYEYEVQNTGSKKRRIAILCFAALLMAVTLISIRLVRLESSFDESFYW